MSSEHLIPVQDERGEPVQDAGKQVTVNTVGGSITNQQGTVIAGPYQFKQEYCVRKKSKMGVIYKKKTVVTKPYWLVEFPNGTKVHFIEAELDFKA
jgi:hypothetical protein